MSISTEITTTSSASQITSLEQVSKNYSDCMKDVEGKENKIFNLMEEYASKLFPICNYSYQGVKVYDKNLHGLFMNLEHYYHHSSNGNCKEELLKSVAEQIISLNNQYNECAVKKQEDTKAAFHAINEEYSALLEQINPIKVSSTSLEIEA